MRKTNIVLYIIIFTLLLGCTKDKSDISLKEENKTPESLQDLNKSIDEILSNIGEIERIDMNIDKVDNEEDDDREDNGQEEDYEEEENGEGGNGEEENGEEGNGEEENGEGGNGEEGNEEEDNGEDLDKNEELIKSAKLEKMWNQIDEKLEKSHELWNSYEVEGIKKGGSSEKANQFDTSINKITKAIEDKNIRDIYEYGSQALLNLKPFLDLYTDDYLGEIAEIKYGVYQYYLAAIYNDKNAALEAIKNKDENIQRVRSELEDNEEKTKQLDKVSYALKNLANSLNEDSKRLYIIKKDIAIKAIDDLEKY